MAHKTIPFNFIPNNQENTNNDFFYIH